MIYENFILMKSYWFYSLHYIMPIKYTTHRYSLYSLCLNRVGPRGKSLVLDTDDNLRHRIDTNSEGKLTLFKVIFTLHDQSLICPPVSVISFPGVRVDDPHVVVDRVFLGPF